MKSLKGGIDISAKTLVALALAIFLGLALFMYIWKLRGRLLP